MFGKEGGAASGRLRHGCQLVQGSRNDLDVALSNAFELAKDARVRHVWPRP